MKYLVWLLVAVVVVVVAVRVRSRRTPDAQGTTSLGAAMTHQQQSLFIAKVEGYFRERGQKGIIANGVAQYEGHEYGLQNLGQVCAKAPEAEWDGLIRQHFDLLRREQNKAAEEIPFDVAKGRLGLCIKQEKDVPVDRLVVWRDLPGMVTYLVLDGKETVQTVPPERLAKWGTTADAVRPMALEFVRKEAGITQKEVDAGDGVTLHVLFGQNLYGSAHVLLLDGHQGVVGKHGCLVAVPMEQVVLCYPINDLKVVGAVHRVAYVAMKRFEQGPGSVSPNLYWYHDGKYAAIEVRMDEGEFVVRPPEEFVTMLNSLAETK